MLWCSQEKPPSLWQVILSVFAALFGVQSGRNRKRDFDRGSPAVFILVGLLAVTLFVLTLCGVVYWVLP
jgi:hypothetical protein